MTEGQKVIQITRRHLMVVLVCLAIAAAMLPRAVEAATGSSVNIVDPSVSSRKAHVTSQGRLLTGLCDSDACAAVDSTRLRVGDGSGALTVDGTLATKQVLYTGSSRVQSHVQFTSGSTEFSLASLIPMSRKVYVTSLTVTNRDTTDADVRFQAADATGGTSCDPADSPSRIGGSDVTDITAKAGDTVNVTFPQPLQFPGEGSAAGPWCVMTLNAGAATFADVTIVGYIV